MRYLHRRKEAQTFVFFLVSFSTAFLLCGLGLDAGLWYLDRARLSRACDAAVITGVANFGKGGDAAGRQQVADKMRQIAAGNFSLLTNATVLTTNMVNNYNQGTNWVYNYKDTANTKGITITLSSGVQGQITLAGISANVKTYTTFMGFTGISSLMKLNTVSVAEAQRRPRLIVLVLDRSGSMTGNDGDVNLPQAVTNFLGLLKSDAANNTVGIVSFSSYARVEMPLTTNFWDTAVNLMTNATSSSKNLTGLKFGGNTCADEGMRLGLEIMRTNEGYVDPRTVKYILFFTDGEFNSVRTMFAAPTWTNILAMPAGVSTSSLTTSGVTTNPFMTSSTYSIATSTLEGAPTSFVKNITSSGGKYPTQIRVLLQPGSVCYTYKTNAAGGYNVTTAYSYSTGRWYSNMLYSTESNVLVTPGYIVDGVQLADSSPSTSSGTYSSQMVNQNSANMVKFLIGKPEDYGLPLGYGYPAGSFYWIFDLSSSCSVMGFYNQVSTNIGTSDSYPAGSLFYRALGSTTNQMSDPEEWKRGAPSWLTNSFQAVMATNSDGRYYARTFQGRPSTNYSTNFSGGAMLSDNGTVTNYNTMSWNGRPTHFYNFSSSTWEKITSWSSSSKMLPLCNWRATTYCDQARRGGVVVYTVGFDNASPTVLQSMANDPSSSTFNSTQPQGRFYQCSTGADIIKYFNEIAQQILAYLSD